MAEIVSNQIPQELKQNQSWVNWKSEQYPDEKKPRKIPYNPKTGHQAKVNDSETWGSFNQSLAIVFFSASSLSAESAIIASLTSFSRSLFPENNLFMISVAATLGIMYL